MHLLTSPARIQQVVVDEYIAEEPDAVDGDPMRSHLPLSFGEEQQHQCAALRPAAGP